MWCWHRIKESETGLCPACRTPYGDSPHEFSAVDLEEVVKANKEKAAAEKKEKERLRLQQTAGSCVGGGSISLVSSGGGIASVGGLHISGDSDCDLALAQGVSNNRHVESLKDRNQLANMRVIRRNLVYAVGLSVSIATEDMLRKPECFGQYGKISKIVLNRNHIGNGEPRRTSASVYVTFVHKEDALSCILAIDGFYLDGRNIRASYGTSKYCSAFIKNVRCNNPDCTYLHCMGDSEDTFTKQEIQAGYVTSGRDVVARQQQIAVTSSGLCAKKRVAGEGLSGTGKIAINHVFPPPTLADSSKISPKSLAQQNLSTSFTSRLPPVSSATTSRSTTTGSCGIQPVNRTGPSAISVAFGKKPRSVSLSYPSTKSNILQSNSTSSQKPGVTLIPDEMLSRQQQQLHKTQLQNDSNTAISHVSSSVGVGSLKNPFECMNSATLNALDRYSSLPLSQSSSCASPKTAASVVARMYSSSHSGSIQPVSHTTLTSLTPLKRASSFAERRDNTASNVISSLRSVTSFNASTHDAVQLPPNMPVPKGLTPAEQNIFMEQRKEAMVAMARQQREMAIKLSALRSGSTLLNCTSHGVSVGTGTSHSSPTSSISSASGPPVTPMKSPQVGSENGIIGPSAIGGTMVENSALPGVTRSGAIGYALGHTTEPLPEGLGCIGAVGSDNNGMLIGKYTSSSLECGSISGSSLVSGFKEHWISNLNRRKNTEEDISGSNSIFHSQPSLTHTGINDNLNGLFSVRHKTDNHLGSLMGTGIWGNENTGKSLLDYAPFSQSYASSEGLHSNEFHGNNNLIRGGDIIRDRSISGSSYEQGGSLLQTKPIGNNKSGSSTLASMLGIELPTGTGSLRESLWKSSTPVPSPVSGLLNDVPNPTPIGSGINTNGSIIIGRSPNLNGVESISFGQCRSTNNRSNSICGNSNDIALLRSLLPGVHITSGNAFNPAASNTTTVLGAGGCGSRTGMCLVNSQDQRLCTPGICNNIQQQTNSRHIASETWGSGGIFSTKQQLQEQQQHASQSNIW